MSGKEGNKYVEAEKVILEFSIERGKRFLQVKGSRGPGTKLTSHEGCIIDNGHIIDTKFSDITSTFLMFYFF